MLEYTLHSDDNLDKLLDDARILPDATFKQLSSVLSVCRNGTKYSFQNACGLKTVLATFKGGKSTYVWFNAMVIGGVIKNPMFESGFRGGDRIGFFDTEQGRARCQLNMNKYFPKESEVYIDVFSLRHVQILDMLPVIERYVIKYKPKVIYIDIASDLTTNINDAEQANFCVNKLSEMAENYSLHCVCCLHITRGSGEASGHIGSALLKRSELVVFIKKIGNVYSVLQRYTRDQSCDPFGFMIVDGMPVLVEDIPSVSKRSASRKSKKDFESVPFEKHIDILKSILPNGTGLRPKEFKATLKTVYGSAIVEIGELLVRELQRFYISKKLITKKAGLLYLQSEEAIIMDTYFDDAIG
jgi:hypothetical protein